MSSMVKKGLFVNLTGGVVKRPLCRSEVSLMMRTLRDMNMSKFVAEDVPLFLALIDDLFPGVRAERASFPEVTAALEKASEKTTTVGFFSSMSASLCGQRHLLARTVDHWD